MCKQLTDIPCFFNCTSRPIGHSVKRLQSTDISCTALAYIYNPMRYRVASLIGRSTFLAPWLLGLACPLPRVTWTFDLLTHKVVCFMPLLTTCANLHSQIWYQTNERMKRRTDERTDGRTDRRTDRW